MLFRSTIPPEFPSHPDAISPSGSGSLRTALRDALIRQCRRLAAHVLSAANGIHPANFFDVAVSHEMIVASRMHADDGADRAGI